MVSLIFIPWGHATSYHPHLKDTLVQSSVFYVQLQTYTHIIHWISAWAKEVINTHNDPLLFQALKSTLIPKLHLISHLKDVFPDVDEPFIRQNFFPDIIAPAVPLDHLIQGLWWLRNHGDELITITDT